MEIICEGNIKHYLSQEENPEVKVRLIALNLIEECEMSVSEAAGATMISAKTISEWLDAWNDAGYEGITRKPQSFYRPVELEEENFVACSYL
jgi:transposase